MLAMQRLKQWPLTILLACALPAAAWGPQTEMSLVMGASQVLSRDGAIPLNNLRSDVKNGASISDSELVDLIPLAQGDPRGAIATEMALLQTVRQGSIDPYYAYRLGALGKLVAQVTAPLSDAPASIRSRYYEDVERNIERANLKPSGRQIVDPNAYFARIYNEANTQADLIVEDYRSGIGFSGVANGSLAADASRSVNAVADVWHTVLTGNVVVANRAESRIRDYIVDALRYYIDRGRPEEIRAAYDRLRELGFQTPDLRKRIADMFFEAKLFDRAIEEYQAVLGAEPGRRDVAQRLAEYYVAQGDDALDRDVISDEALTTARDAYSEALNYDKTHPTAQEKLLETERMIRERETRRMASEEAIAEAENLFQQAETLALNEDTAAAITRLFEAQMLYSTVTEEFPRLASEARIGASNAAARINQLKSQLISDAASLSGAGSNINARLQATETGDMLDDEALDALVRNNYDRQIDELRIQLRDQMFATP